VLLGLVAMTAATTARASEEGDVERIVAYSADKYAVQSNPDPAEPKRSRYMIRRLATGEPVDNVACASRGSCDLTTALGMKACSYSRVVAGRNVAGLELDPTGEADASLWTLSIDSRGARVPVLTIYAEGELTLRAVVRAGRRVVAIVEETGGSEGRTTDHALVLEEADFRSARLEGSNPDREVRQVDPHASDGDPLPPLRTATARRPMNPMTVIRGARVAAAAGMDRLAACWITHHASLMKPRDVLTLAMALQADPLLMSLIPKARPRRVVRLPAFTF
jgi:hypothetical protein